MDGFRTSLLATLFVALILFNGLLYWKGEGVRLFSRQAGDGWTLECFYYTPLTIFRASIDVAGECPTRIPAPGMRP